MSVLGTKAPVVFDPYHFPNFTPESLDRDFTLLVYGLSTYETILCLKAYFSICSKEKMKTPIFQLMTLAIFSTFGATLMLLILQINMTRLDLVISTGEYTVNILQCLFTALARAGYFIAATFRTRALLQKFPKVLYCFYLMLIISMIDQIVIIRFAVNIFNILYHSTPESFYNDLPAIIEDGLRFKNVATATMMFDMVYANFLAVSFVYPIFTTLNMDLLSAIKAMIKLGDVQKMLVLSASSILCVGFLVGLHDTELAFAVLTLWLNAQNTQFLHLSYFSSAELLVTHSKVRQSTVSSRAQESIPSGQTVKTKIGKLENV